MERDQVLTSEVKSNLNRVFDIYGFPQESFESAPECVQSYDRYLIDKIDLLVNRIVDDIRNVVHRSCVSILLDEYHRVVKVLWALRSLYEIAPIIDVDNLCV